MAIIPYSMAKDRNKKLSANFSVGEMACNDGSDTVIIDSDLILILQKIRTHFNRPVTISSGYRTPTWNRKIGGASNSYHTKGQAADIYINGVEPAVIAAYAEKLGVLGIGLYTTQKFVHIDTRKTKYYWKNAGKEVSVSTHGGTPTYGAMIKAKAGLSEETITYLKKYTYPYDLLEKLALNLK